MTVWTHVLASCETSFSFVCEENFGSRIFSETTAVSPSRQSSPESVVSLRFFVRLVRLGVLLDRPRQRRLQPLEVGPAVLVRDRVREAEDLLLVAVVPLEGDVEPLVLGVDLRVPRGVLHVREDDDALVERLAVLVQVVDEGGDPALVPEDVLPLALLVPLVDDLDRDAGVQEGELAEPLREGVEVVGADREDLGVRLERDLRPGLVRPSRPRGSAGRGFPFA